MDVGADLELQMVCDLVMKNVCLAIIIFFLMCGPSEAARGFGTTFGLGTTDIITTAHSGPVAATQSFAAWVWINGGGGNNLGRVIAYDLGCMICMSTVSSMQFNATFDTTSGNWFWTAPATGAWHHVVLTYDAGSTSNDPVVYVDGASVSVGETSAPVGTYTGATGSMNIGNRNAGGASRDRVWDGKLAEVAYWNVVLTASEARALAQGYSALKVRPASLQFYYPLYGEQSGSGTEQDWGPSRLEGTVVSSLFQTHPPVQFWPFQWVPQ